MGTTVSIPTPIYNKGRGWIRMFIGFAGSTFEKKENIVVHKVKRKSRGQSIVEFTILLPLLLMLLSSLIEFGFALNEYLDLIDTTRETARFLSDQMPFSDPDTHTYREAFYTEGVNEMQRTLSRAGWINLDPTKDDLVISIFAVKDILVQTRYPLTFPDSRCGGANNGGEMGWRMNCKKISSFISTDINSRISSVSSAPDTGIVLVELFYDYEMKLGLPWVTGIVGDSIPLHAYSFAPNAASEP